MMLSLNWQSPELIAGCLLGALLLTPLFIIIAMAKGRRLRDQLSQLMADNFVKTQGMDERRATLLERENEIGVLTNDLVRLRQSQAVLESEIRQERAWLEEQKRLLAANHHALSDTFKSLSFDALKQNNQTFLDLAKTTLTQFQEHAKGDLSARQQEIAGLVGPVKEALMGVDKKIHELEKERVSAYHVLRQQVQELVLTQQQLRSETSQLVQALKTPSVRGRWGEMQLKRVVEMAGMLPYCDFLEQVHSADSADMPKMRPDMVIRLPGGKQIIVDAKAPLNAYLEGMSSNDEAARLIKMKDHARHVKNHISALSKRGYWEQFDPTPDFVVLFLPGEMFFSAALEQDPSLIEAGVHEKVILATPTTLIAMLRAISYGWRQESLASSAREVGELGRELYTRLADMGGHFKRLGRHLGQTVESFNQSVGSLERRVLVTARKFQAIDSLSGSEPIEQIKPVDSIPRPLTAMELVSENDLNPLPNIKDIGG
jgi:DNA recombination protein RmuC